MKKYAKAKGLKLVIRQQDSSLDEKQPLAEILKSLNRGIIYEDGLDITDDDPQGTRWPQCRGGRSPSGDCVIDEPLRSLR